jgi:hypothetical protein
MLFLFIINNEIIHRFWDSVGPWWGPKVTEVSYSQQRCQWHRYAVCSWVRFPYKKQCVEFIRKDIRKQAGCTAVSMTPLCMSQRCQRHRCAIIFDIRLSGTQGKLFDEKKTGVENLVSGSRGNALMKKEIENSAGQPIVCLFRDLKTSSHSFFQVDGIEIILR